MMKHLVWLLSLALISGCSSLGSGNGEDDPLAPAALVDFDPEIKLKKQWSHGGVGKIDWVGSNLKPVLASGVIYAADSAGKVIAVSADTGDTLWKQNLDTSLSGGVGAAGDAVLVGSTDGEVFSLSASSGELNWKAQVSSEVLAAPAGDGSIVVVQAQDASLVGLNASSGERVWAFRLDVPILTLRGTSSPIVAGSTVIASFANGKVYGLDIGTGSLLWENRIAIPQGRTELERIVDIDDQPLLVEGMLFAASYQGRLTAINRGTGQNMWFQDSSSHLNLAHDQGRVYVTEEGDVVSAYRDSSGQSIWRNDQLRYRKLGGPAVVGGYVAVGDSEGYLHVMSQTDGRFVARQKVDGSGVGVPMIGTAETLYVMDNGGGLTAYRFE